MKTKLVHFSIGLVFAVTLGLQPVWAQGTNATNIVVWAAPVVEPPPEPLPNNPWWMTVERIGDHVTFGPTYSFRFKGTAEHEPSISGMIIALTRTNDLTKTYSVVWQAGVADSYVPAWSEDDIGIGVMADTLRVSDSTHSGISGVVNGIPVAGTILPKLTICRTYLAVETPVDKITSQQELRIAAGIQFPMGPAH